MRWKEPKEGDTRIKTKFLLFPKCIENEWRWLEITTWIEIYVVYRLRNYNKWEANAWIDK